MTISRKGMPKGLQVFSGDFIIFSAEFVTNNLDFAEGHTSHSMNDSISPEDNFVVAVGRPN